MRQGLHGLRAADAGGGDAGSRGFDERGQHSAEGSSRPADDGRPAIFFCGGGTISAAQGQPEFPGAAESHLRTGGANRRPPRVFQRRCQHLQHPYCTAPRCFPGSGDQTAAAADVPGERAGPAAGGSETRTCSGTGPLLATQRIERTTPPSALRAAPFVAEESGLQRNTTRGATSSGRAKRRNKELGRTLRKNSASNSALVCFEDAAKRSTNSFAPSEAVGPGSTVFTVTPVPAVVSARPREIASCAVFVMP